MVVISIHQDVEVQEGWEVLDVCKVRILKEAGLPVEARGAP